MPQFKELQKIIPLLKEYRALTSPYGWRTNPLNGGKEWHKGVDLVKEPYGEIKAFVDGVVVHAQMGVSGSGVGGYGITTIIKDKGNHLHLYAHLHQALVRVGQYVQIGQVIGKQGNTGASAGQHLHYEVRPYGNKPCFGYGDKSKPWTFTVEPLQYVEQYYQQNNMNVVNKPVNKGDKFMDDHLISPWAKDAVYEMKKLGLMKGDETGNFHPDKPITREELAVVISRLLKYKAV
ncbi:peptidoglycan DD-metalloendopeptidase family protein [Brevibacillus agri]|uniref:peptidoglycan DD-metalloendopeptidase family protein n=1 Tax=Brevibacillus agri TaxID=51101 RepID=UPI0025B6A947|nr:peptidoglycan DD-metalloendopeptidase family protein [Brevibacillus agri]MDN4093591.1 peptidoglycan DD-metalloendopeptidase family protein [Brevibacillus agri]